MESQRGYNLQCKVIDNLLITNVLLFTTIPLQYDPIQKKKSRNGEFTNSSGGGGGGGRRTCNILGDQRTDPS